MAYISAPIVTRPANTDAYTAGDVVGGLIRFVGIGPTSDHILVTAFDLTARITAIPSGMTSFRLHIYNDIPSAIADNAAWDLPAGDRAYYLGYIDSAIMTDLGSTCYAQADWVNKQFKLGENHTSLYAYLQTIGGYTPAGNSEVYVPRLRAVGL